MIVTDFSVHLDRENIMAAAIEHKKKLTKVKETDQDQSGNLIIVNQNSI